MSCSFGIVTPSYRPDFQRCQLLVRSIEQYVKPPFTHYIVVDRRDYKLFATLANHHTQVLTVESVLPWWIRREPIFGKVWLSLKTPPIRNWLLQQIVKLAVAQRIAEDVAVFIDSDVVFVRPFTLETLSQGAQVRLYRDDVGNDVQRQMHQKWHAAAAQLLGLEMPPNHIPDYIGNLITWRKDYVIQLCDYLQQQSGRGWIETLGQVWNLSEYVLYGMYVDQILSAEAQHYPIRYNLCHDYWFTQSLSQSELQNWLSQLHPEQVAVMISAKSGMTVNDYAPLLAQMAV